MLLLLFDRRVQKETSNHASRALLGDSVRAGHVTRAGPGKPRYVQIHRFQLSSEKRMADWYPKGLDVDGFLVSSVTLHGQGNALRVCLRAFYVRWRMLRTPVGKA